jgi:two-component system LytT family response regulator
MTGIRAIVVDDMPPARAKLRRYLAEDSRVTVVGEAGSCRQAALLIGEQRPQIAFLDIRLPDGNGLDLLEQPASPVGPIGILVTAFDQYALRAFDMDARDYLLKPFSRERFRIALNRAIDRLSQRAAAQNCLEKQQYVRQLSIKNQTGRLFIDLNEVDVIVADDHYLSVSCGGRVYLIRGSLRALQKQLDPEMFMRVHRSTVVRIESIKAIRERGRGDYALELRDGSSIPISRSHVSAIRGLLKLRRL